MTVARSKGRLIFAALLALPGLASARDATDPQLALAERVLVASGNDARVAAIHRSLGMRTSLATAIEHAFPNFKETWRPALEAALDGEMQAEAKDLFEKNRQIYATHFTAAELNDMLSFYASPGGKALVAQTPAILQEKTAFGQSLGKVAVDRLIKSLCTKVDCAAK